MKVLLSDASGLPGGLLLQELQHHAYALTIMHFQPTFWGKGDGWRHSNTFRGLRPPNPQSLRGSLFL